MGKLSKRIEDAKKEVYDALQKRYGDFYPNLNATLELASRVRNLSDDMQNVTERIEREVSLSMSLHTHYLIIYGAFITSSSIMVIY